MAAESMSRAPFGGGHVRVAPSMAPNTKREQARQQRETELLRAASRVADTLRDHGVKAVDAPIRGWLIHRHILPPLPTPPRPKPTSPKPGQGFVTVGRSSTCRSPITVQDTMVQYHLGVDGMIYLNGKPIGHPGNAEIDTVEQYLAEIAVKNHLDPELFKDDDVQS